MKIVITAFLALVLAIPGALGAEKLIGKHLQNMLVRVVRMTIGQLHTEELWEDILERLTLPLATKPKPSFSTANAIQN